MLLRLCVSCGTCGCLGNPCKPQRKPAEGKIKAGAAKQVLRIDREISKYPAAIQAQIRAKLENKK